MCYYVYHIKIIPTGEYYYGARYSKKAKPEDLGESYFTSSSIVQKKLFEHGLQNVRFSIIATYTDKQACSDHEYSLIKEHMSDELCLNKDRAKFGKGYQHTTEARNKISNALKEQWKDPNIRQKKILASQGRTWKLSEEKRKIVSAANKNKWTSETAKVCAGTKWINNGIINKRIPKDNALPDGFKVGRFKPSSVIGYS